MPTININQTNASETAKGIVEEATQAQVNAGTDTGETGAQLFVAPSKFLAGILVKVLTGFVAGANIAIAATDTLAQALAKIQGQINARATLSSPTFTGTPNAPTAAFGNDSTQIATTEFVQDAVAAGGVSDGDKGDITVTASGATWTIDPNVVEYTKSYNGTQFAIVNTFRTLYNY